MILLRPGHTILDFVCRAQMAYGLTGMPENLKRVKYILKARVRKMMYGKIQRTGWSNMIILYGSDMQKMRKVRGMAEWIFLLTMRLLNALKEMFLFHYMHMILPHGMSL